MRKNTPALELSGVTLDLSARTHIMGVLNVTPDSFSDGGRFVKKGLRPDVGMVVDAAMKMVDDGADIIDVGGESSRPGSMPVPAAEEIARVVPVIRGISSRTRTPISIDTCKSETAKAAIDAGASIINDISATRFDPEMPGLAARTNAALILMHMKGTPADMQDEPAYEDLVGEVTSFLKDAAGRALAAGVPVGRIMLDVGIGFGKTVSHNLELINRIDEFAALGYPIVLGVSRKAFIGALTGGPPPEDRLEGTIAACVLGISRGAAIVRVHDVKAAKRAALVADAILGA